MATVNVMKNKRTQSRAGLAFILSYCKWESKTVHEGRKLVSGVNCLPESAYKEFMNTKLQYGKTDGRMFYHFTQSFSPTEDITPETAHEIAVKFAQQMFPGFEVLVATHTDKAHTHSHFVVNSVSCENGYKYHSDNENIERLRAESDKLCLQYGLSVLPPKEQSQKVKRMSSREYRAAERGESLGGRPAYGYKKVDEDSKEIIPDDEAAAVVQRIFSLCASGKGPNQIARILREDKVLTPSNYYFQKHKKGHFGLDTTRPYAWSSSTVTGILDNKVYLGHTVGLRTTTISYKNKTTVHRPESECAVVENTHPALITQEQWDIVQDVRTHKKRTPKQMEEPNIFSGLAYCADCKRTMVLHRASTMKKSDYNFKCYTYGKRGKGECTPHHICEDELYAITLDDLRRVTHFARKKERQFAEYINRKNTTQLRQEITALQMELDTMRKRRSELTALFKRLYEDNVLGRVTNEQFRILSADYNAEQREIDEALPLKEERLEKLKSSSANVDAFIEKAKRYKTIDKLTPEIVRLFIARIEIGERTVKYSRHSAQKIRIIYRDIGEWDYEEAVEAEQQQPQIVAVTVTQPELLPA